MACRRGERGAALIDRYRHHQRSKWAVMTEKRFGQLRRCIPLRNRTRGPPTHDNRRILSIERQRVLLRRVGRRRQRRRRGWRTRGVDGGRPVGWLVAALQDGEFLGTTVDDTRAGVEENEDEVVAARGKGRKDPSATPGISSGAAATHPVGICVLVRSTPSSPPYRPLFEPEVHFLSGTCCAIGTKPSMMVLFELWS